MYIRQCPNCGEYNVKVIDCRETEDGTFRRRRECLDCGHRFTTFEVNKEIFKGRQNIDSLLEQLDAKLEEVNFLRNKLRKAVKEYGEANKSLYELSE